MGVHRRRGPVVTIGDKVRHYALGDGVVFYDATGRVYNEDGEALILFPQYGKSFWIHPTKLEIIK